MGNIGKRTAVYQRRRMLKRLYQVGQKRIFQKRSHGAFSMDVMNRYRTSVKGISNNHLAQAFFQVRNT